MIDLPRLLARTPRDSAEAVVGMARLNSATLNAHLRGRLGGGAGSTGSLLTPPFLEGAFPWLPAPGGWDGLADDLLHPRTLEVLRAVSRPPYSHQVEAWERLCADEPSSVIFQTVFRPLPHFWTYLLPNSQSMDLDKDPLPPNSRASAIRVMLAPSSSNKPSDSTRRTS